MARQKCTFKCNSARQKCTFKSQDKIVCLHGKTKANKIVRTKWQDKSVRLNGKTKVYV